jgi:hypothetical protein
MILAPTSFGVSQLNDGLIVQGHSPIVLLVIDPYGHEIGCTNQPCTSTSSPYYVDTIPAAEGPAFYNFGANLVYVARPYIGTWTVKYTGTSSGTFTITAADCGPVFCSSVVVTSGSTTTGAPGATPFVVNQNGQITKCNPVFCA